MEYTGIFWNIPTRYHAVPRFQVEKNKYVVKYAKIKREHECSLPINLNSRSEVAFFILTQIKCVLFLQYNLFKNTRICGKKKETVVEIYGCIILVDWGGFEGNSF